jgi:hypothetical protein
MTLFPPAKIDLYFNNRTNPSWSHSLKYLDIQSRALGKIGIGGPKRFNVDQHCRGGVNGVRRFQTATRAQLRCLLHHGGVNFSNVQIPSRKENIVLTKQVFLPIPQWLAATLQT